MDFLEYISEFTEIINENYPNKEKRTIEEYLATFATLPPFLEELDTPKCAIQAEALRDSGNKCYVNRKYESAAHLYTVSLQMSPPYSKCAALAYANRSAVFYRLSMYQECITDVERALELPYPEDLKSKIISRKESALVNLSAAKNETKNNKEIDNTKYAELPKESCGVDFIFGGQEGRKLVAKKPFQTGDVVMIEKPYLMVPEPEEKPTYCHHCLKKSWCLVPCDRCSEAVYCSEKCREEAYENYHRIECTIQRTLLNSVPLSIKALLCQLRCLNIFTEQGNNLKSLYDDFKEIEEKPDFEELRLGGERFVGNTRKVFLSCLSRKEIKHNTGALFEATYLVALLRNYTDFFKSNTDVPIVAKLLVKLSAAYAMSVFSIPYSGKIDRKAHATFPLIRLVKHACINNTITYITEDGRLVLRASQYIRPGDEIMNNYHDLHFSFEEATNRSGKIIQCKRVCAKCDKTYVYPSERQPYVKIDKKLRTRLQKNPYDVEGLWRVLNLIRGKHQHYTLQAQMIKTMLVDAYEGRGNSMDGYTQLHVFGIL